MYHVKQSRLLAGIQKAKLTWFLQTSKTRQATSPTPTRDRRKRELNQCVIWIRAWISLRLSCSMHMMGFDEQRLLSTL